MVGVVGVFEDEVVRVVRVVAVFNWSSRVVPALPPSSTEVRTVYKWSSNRNPLLFL